MAPRRGLVPPPAPRSRSRAELRLGVLCCAAGRGTQRFSQGAGSSRVLPQDGVVSGSSTCRFSGYLLAGITQIGVPKEG